MNGSRFKAHQHPDTLHLPITGVLEAVSQTLADRDQLLVEAPPGAGKTTVIPLALLEAPWLAGRKILMLQPRRIAARSAAARMAELLDERPGETVGYRMRLESRVGPSTRIEVVTEGILLRMLAEDPSLEDVAVIIFDEFHERSLDGDLALTLALHGRELFEREHPLKLLVMSATLEQKDLVDYLSASVIRSEGRAFPVAVHYRPARSPKERIADRVKRAIEDAVDRHPESSVLVFLPGQGEINQVAKALSVSSDISVFPLLGSLSLEEQRRAIAPLSAGQRKIVLATNVAETSLTIEGIHVVIDSGLERRPLFDPNTGMSRLHTVSISRASAEQRLGRAGRLAPGTCYRLWAESQHAQRSAHLAPEIEEADLAGLVLQLFDWGVYDPAELKWLTPPPAGPYQQAVDLLLSLGAAERTATGLALTNHGSAMAGVATHPRLAHMLIAAAEVGALEQGALLAAMLSDRDPLRHEGPDMETRLEYLQSGERCPARYRGWQQRTRKLAKQLQSRIDAPVVTPLSRPVAEQLTGYLIACAYPERIARRRHNGGFQLANGRSARFAEPSSLDKARWLAVAEVGGRAGQRGDGIYSASALDSALFDTLLSDLLREEIHVDWDKQSGRFVAERRVRCGELLFASESLREVPEAERVGKLLELIRDGRLTTLPWDKSAESFVARARQMRALDEGFPNYSEDALADSLEDWLAPFLVAVKRLQDLKKIDLLEALKARMTWEQQRELDQSLPQRFAVPSGSSIAIDYHENPPVLAVKLQEMFGSTETPSVAKGRLPLVVHLLSPAGRPLQVTRDIAHFWTEGYAEVRKEMRGRYPKHPWPEDPLTALPTRHTKKRQPG
ncbi:MAG: ATP-dependent helicase HrpB [Pseudomonadota bacterium]